MRSSVSPAFLRLRAPESTQKLQPLIWLARRWASSSVVDGTPPSRAALSRAWAPGVAPGRIVAGLRNRECMVTLHPTALSGLSGRFARAGGGDLKGAPVLSAAPN